MRRAKRLLVFLALAIFWSATVSCDRSGARPPAQAESDRTSSDKDLRAASLDEAKQKYIWEIEHTTFELETKFGKAILTALKHRDAAELGKLLRPGCSGSVLDPSQRVVVDRQFIREASSPEASPGIPVDASGLAAYLCKYFDGYERVELAKCRVLALDAEDRRPESGRWTAKLLITGSGADAAGTQLELSSLHRLSCEFANDDEIIAGNIVTRWTILSEKSRSSPGALFEELTEAAGLNKIDIQDNWNRPTDEVRQYHTQIAVEDFNLDGLFDIAVASFDGRWRLLSGVEGGKNFIEVTSYVKLPMWSEEEPHSKGVRNQVYLATWIDFDNDGYPDLILGDRLFHNVDGKRFEDVTLSSGLTFDYNPRGCVVADYDCDGLLDLYVLYQNPLAKQAEGPAGWVGDDESGAENQLWRNTGNGRFVNVTERAQAGGGRRQTFAAAWFHANQDHYPDLYVANDFGKNVLLINQGNGRFEDASEMSGTADYATSMGVATGDLTGDGEPDIYVANMFSKMGRRIIAHIEANDYPPGVFEQIRGSCAGNTLYTRDAPAAPSAQSPYQETSASADVNEVGWAYAPALADFDSDGLLDIYATTGFLSFQRSKPDG